MKIYRSHNGLFLGVCTGLEESLGIPARYSRLILILLAILFRAWIILGLYLLAAILMPIRSGEDWKIQDNFETLSRDARQWSRKEFREIREWLRSAADSSSKYDPHEDLSEEPASKIKPKGKASEKKSTSTADKTAQTSGHTTSSSKKSSNSES